MPGYNYSLHFYMKSGLYDFIFAENRALLMLGGIRQKHLVISSLLSILYFWHVTAHLGYTIATLNLIPFCLVLLSYQIMLSL